MITSTISFAVHIMLSSIRIFQPVRQVVEYILALPYTNMSNKGIPVGIHFNGKHLKKGDPLPQYNGKLRLYNTRYCPFAQRTMLALLAKNIDFEAININLKDKPEWLTQKSPLGKVPSLEIEKDVCIYESLITVEYLDDVYPQRPLLSNDPVTKAYDKIIVETSGALFTLTMKLLREPEKVTNDHVVSYNNTLRFVQDQLKERKSSFFGGNDPGYTDYMLWPWFERILVLQDKYNVLKFDDIEFKLLNEYITNMLMDPIVSCYIIPKDVHLKFLESYALGGVPNYDLMCKEV